MSVKGIFLFYLKLIFSIWVTESRHDVENLMKIKPK